MKSDTSQRNILLGLIAAAIVVFGAFVLLNLSGRPLNSEPPADMTVEAETTLQATAEATAATDSRAVTDATAEAVDGGGAAATPETVAESTEPAEDAGNAAAGEERSADAEPTVTSQSRVQDSILIGTAVTPVLASTPANANAPVSEGDGNPTPTSLSRVPASILAGTPTAPEEPTGPGDSPDEAPDARGRDGAKNATPTSLSRVTHSILVGTEITPVLRATQPASAPEAASESEGATPTSLSRVSRSVVLESAVADGEATTPETTGQQAEATASAEATGEPEATEAGALAAADIRGLPTPVPGQPHESPSALAPAGPVAARQANLWWLMLGLGTAIYVFVLALVARIVIRRRQASGVPATAGETRLFMVGGGVVLPMVVLTLLFGLSVHTLSALAVANQPTHLTVQIVGYRWWWEVRYPDHDFVTANEIHIPAGQPVRFELTSEDVIHSFWVPQLGGKMDLIPGRTNQIWLQADAPGVYRGQCAEYCGLQHAKMALLVIAEPQADFDRWVQGQQQPARQPESELAAQGQEVFLNAQCIACHTVRGTNASGQQGPDLTHFGSRRTIGAATMPNTAGHLGGWIVDSQGIKPGNLMPPQNVPGGDLQALIAYLTSLQ